MKLMGYHVLQDYHKLGSNYFLLAKKLKAYLRNKGEASMTDERIKEIEQIISDTDSSYNYVDYCRSLLIQELIDAYKELKGSSYSDVREAKAIADNRLANKQAEVDELIDERNALLAEVERLQNLADDCCDHCSYEKAYRQVSDIADSLHNSNENLNKKNIKLKRKVKAYRRLIVKTQAYGVLCSVCKNDSGLRCVSCISYIHFKPNDKKILEKENA
jgi:cell division protein FtsB